MKKPYKCLKFDFNFLQKEELSTHITSVHEMKNPTNVWNVTSFLQKRSFEHTCHFSAWNEETLQMFEMWL